MQNLIIVTVGDNSLHQTWLSSKRNFKIAVIYYGNNRLIEKDYSETADYFLKEKGEKYHLIKNFYLNNISLFKNFKLIWMPDDDLFIAPKDINRLFDLAEKKKFKICQPAMIGYNAHHFTFPIKNSIYRYSNFVEVIGPLMNINTFKSLIPYFKENYSAWGFEFLWFKILGEPKNEIAIIDSIIMVHSRPIGTNYSRFPKSPKYELDLLNQKFELNLNLKDFNKNFKTFEIINE